MCVLRTSCEYSNRHAPVPDTAACGGSSPSIFACLPACLPFFCAAAAAASSDYFFALL